MHFKTLLLTLALHTLSVIATPTVANDAITSENLAGHALYERDGNDGIPTICAYLCKIAEDACMEQFPGHTRAFCGDYVCTFQKAYCLDGCDPWYDCGGVFKKEKARAIVDARTPVKADAKAIAVTEKRQDPPCVAYCKGEEEKCHQQFPGINCGDYVCTFEPDQCLTGCDPWYNCGGIFKKTRSVATPNTRAEVPPERRELSTADLAFIDTLNLPADHEDYKLWLG